MEKIDILFHHYPEGHQYYIPLYLGYTFRLPLGEVFAITLSDINLKSKTMRINKYIVCEPKGELRVTRIKERIYKLPEETVRILQRHISKLDHPKQYDFGFPICVDEKTGKYVKPWAMYHITKKFSWFKFSMFSRKKQLL